MRTPVMEWFDLAVPVVQAPMGGGPATPALAAAVSEAGGLGSIAAGYLDGPAIREQLGEVRRRTDRAFAVNLFVLEQPGPSTVEARAAVEAALAPLRRELGLAPGGVTPAMPDPAEQVAAVLADPPAAVSFTFGLPSRDLVAELARRGTRTVVTVTSTSEAAAAAALGVDAVCVQGLEAGAHSGSVDGSRVPARSTAALVTEIGATIPQPVIAAGGIVDGRGVAAVLVLGAAAAQLGTAFLLAPEAGTSEAHRRALQRADGADTELTRCLTGRWARAIPNRLTALTAGLPAVGYPDLHLLTADIRRQAASRGRDDLMALWAGDLYRSCPPRPAGEVIGEVGRTLSRLLRDW